MTHPRSLPLSRRQRLRARASGEGVSTLDDVQLLELLLVRAAPRHDVGAAAAALIARFGSLPAVLAANPDEIARTGRLGAAALSDLRVVQEIAVRLARGRVADDRPLITSWTALLDYVRTALVDRSREQFRALFLDTRNRLLRDEQVADGSVDHAPVYPREVIRRALELSAASVILVHNHPSGDPTPSRADIELTRQIAEAGRLLKITVHDHLVVARQGISSFKALGLL
jgi:DNA repair protein RadC